MELNGLLELLTLVILKKSRTCELIETEKDVQKLTFTSMTTKWTIKPITMLPNSCIVESEIIYSSDVDRREMDLCRAHILSYFDVLKYYGTTLGGTSKTSGTTTTGSLGTTQTTK